MKSQKNSIVSQILSSIVFRVPFGLPMRILDVDRTKWALAFISFSVFIFIFCYIFVSGYVC